MSTNDSNTSRPVFGHILVGGALSGALIRDIRLANELAQRGFEVHVWWVLDIQKEAPLDPRIKQHVIFSGLRYLYRLGRPVMDALGKLSQKLYSDKKRSRYMQKREKSMAAMMGNFLKLVADGVETDPGPLRRFIREVTDAKVTHLLPMLAAVAPAAPMLVASV